MATSSSSSTENTQLWKLLNEIGVEEVPTCFKFKIAETPAILRKITKTSDKANMNLDLSIWTTAASNKNKDRIHGIAVKASNQKTGYEICFLHCKLFHKDGVLDFQTSKERFFECGLLQKDWESSIEDGFSEIEQLVNLQSMEAIDGGGCPTMEVVLRDMKIPDDFFQSMKDLRVLDICHSGIYSVPISVFRLNKLSVLILSNSVRLTELSPLVGELKNLRNLDLSFTLIRKLPIEIGGLLNLQKLGLRRVEIQAFPVEISNLPLLEELDMFQGYSKWTSDSVTDDSEQVIERSCLVNLQKVADITNLTSLQLMVEKLECFNVGILKRINSLRKYSLIISPKTRSQSMDDFCDKDFNKVLVVQFFLCSTLDQFGILVDLECLIISVCRNLSSVSLLVGKQRKLRDLRIENCGGVRELTASDNETPLKNLENLSLVTLPLLQEELQLGKSLKKVRITRCPGLKNLQISLNGIDRLEQLSIGTCEGVETLVRDKIEKLEKLMVFHLPELTSIGVPLNLKDLHVWRCPKLRSFPSGFCVFEGMENLHLSDSCEVEKIVSEEDIDRNKVLPRLRKLSLQRLESLERVWEGKLGLGAFENLREFSVSQCLKIKALLNFGFRCLDNLKEIHVSYCDGLESIIENEAAEEDGIALKSLERIHITNASRLTKIFTVESGVEAFANLEVLYLSNCSSLKFVIPSASSKWLGKLHHIYVGDCHSIEKIIGDEGVPRNALPCLENLLIHNLSRLKALWEGDLVDGSLKSLKFLEVKKCLELENLVSSSLRKLEKLEIIRVEDCGRMDSIMGKKPVERFALPALKILDLSNLGGLKIIWWGGLETGALGSLERLTVGNCPELEGLWDGEIGKKALESLTRLRVFNCPKLKILLSSSLQRLEKLEEIVLSDCGTEIMARGMRENNALQSLKTLELRNLPRLEIVWEEGELGPGALRELKRLSIKGCPLLEKVPYGLNKCQNLESIVIQDCARMEKAVGEMEEIAFPNLERLYLQSLPNLKVISEREMGVGILENVLFLEVRGINGLKSFPSDLQNLHKLKTFRVKECEEMEVLIDGLWEKNALPNLESLDIEVLPKLKILWQGVLGTESLTNMKRLSIKRCPKLKYFPYGLLKLDKLEMLTVNNCDVMEIAFREERAEAAILPSLIQVRVEEMPKLRGVWEGIVEPRSILYLIVKECPQLTKLPLGCDISSLKNITGNKHWWDRLELEGDLKSKLEKLYKPWPQEEPKNEVMRRNRYRGLL